MELNEASQQSSLEAVGAADADLVCLQEVTPDWEVALRARYGAKYPYMLFHTDGGAAGLAALSRFPLTDLGLREGPGGWHPAWHFLAENPGDTLQVINVHLRSLLSGDGNPVQSYLSTGSDHLRQIESFTADSDAQLSTIVLGDFNEDPDGSAVRYLERLGFQNALPLYHPGQPTWRYGSVGDQLSKTFDHILFDQSLRSLNSWVVQQGASDHLPVVAHLEPYEW
ncbi:MAG TPA: endonuclease/exonuclease/phosphatase family protein [Polyangiaceae bacterium]|nr:endonuclease/exonuclease/phosphatase family protein [Polyangiaceae bacterium]